MRKGGFMTANEIQSRCLGLAVRIINMAKHMPQDHLTFAICNQVVRSSTSVGANYRSACRSKSRRDFINKLKIVEEELDETMYWLQLIGSAEILPAERLKSLMDEGNELLSIIVQSILTARRNEQRKKCPN
jgi:four helix bundle protein